MTKENKEESSNLAPWDSTSDELEDAELEEVGETLGKEHILDEDTALGDSNARYIGYSVVIPRAFRVVRAVRGVRRYLTFSSDFGEALRPRIKESIVTGTLFISIGYFAYDVYREVTKMQKLLIKNGIDEQSSEFHRQTRLMVAERTTFHIISSFVVPHFVIHNAVHLSSKLFNRIGRFSKWGPSIVGLSCIPIMPYFLDRPIEKGVEWAFHQFQGPKIEPKQHSS